MKAKYDWIRHDKLYDLSNEDDECVDKEKVYGPSYNNCVAKILGKEINSDETTHSNDTLDESIVTDYETMSIATFHNEGDVYHLL